MEKNPTLESIPHAMQDPTSAAAETDQQHQPPPPSSSKRSNRAKRPVFKVLPGQIAFRLVCHASIVGGLIGSSGSIVSQLRRETGCKIHCEDSVAGTEDRVILVIGSLSPRKGLALGDGVEVEVSNAQEAAVRVFERVWELEADKGFNPNRAINGEVMCKLLAHTSQIGAVVGKGGKNITTIRNNSGTKIRVCPPPQCASKDEELVQITGGILAVKKALIAVSHCLQDCPPLGKVPVSVSTPTVSSSDRSSPDPHAELFPHLNSFLPSMEGLSISDASKRTTNSNGTTSHDSKGTEHEVVFRLLCSNNVAGSVIGKRGAIVRTLESKTGASIIFAAPLSKFTERIVTISAIENRESSYSPAQDAVILVFARIIEDHIGKGFLPVSSIESPVTARLLVASSTVNCLSGNEGQVISELKEVTGADIQILHGEPVPNASDNDVVVQITGGYRCVHNALYEITCRIRDNLLSNEVVAEGRMKSNFQGNKDTVGGSPFAHGKKSTFPSGRFRPQNAGVRAETISENGVLHTDLSDNLERGRGNMLATVTNTTVEIVVSEHVFGSVYGEDGGNLDRIRQISGANVTVYDPSVGTNGGRVVISGTPDQTFAAQSLLQAFIQTDKAVHSHVIKSGFSYLLGHKLIDGHIKCGSITEARKLFDELPNKHIVTWNSMISSHVSHGKRKEAVELYGNMLLEGVLPDAYTFSAIFKAFSELGLLSHGQRAHGLAVVLGLEVMDGFVASAIVDMYAKFDKMRDAHLVFDRVLEKDVVLFTALIVGYAQHGLDGEALEVFEDMVDRRIKPNEYTLASILISCGNLGDLVNGQLIHGLVVKSGLESVVASQTSLLTMYSRCSMIEDSIKVFNQLSYASQVTWTSFIAGLVQNGREEVALSVFREMIRCSGNKSIALL
ncbi:Tetratricopeptide-like helical domain superfamily [Sesbania bispinosa]|nr:Tetratricopeptide-like helical domain superfamily [Sesbania bispinosa]